MDMEIDYQKMMSRYFIDVLDTQRFLSPKSRNAKNAKLKMLDSITQSRDMFDSTRLELK